MLHGVINALRGKVELEAEGAFPERLLNLCAQRGVLFWNVEWLEPTRLRFTVTRRGCRTAVFLGEKAMCTVTRAGQSGLLAFLGRFRRRYALLTGLALSLAAVCVLSQFVLTVEVAGNQRVPTAVILSELRRQGLRPGAYGPGLDEAGISTRALLQLPELSWMSVNLYGTRAQVLVREATPKPEVVDLSRTGDVVARAGGIVTRMDTLSGEALVKEGDTVLVEEPSFVGCLNTFRSYVGRKHKFTGNCVRARTWRTLEAALPLEAQVKDYTGAEQSRWSVSFLGRSFVFCGNGGISFDKYDKISQVWELVLPGGLEMPLAVRRETFREYAAAPAAVDREAARALLEERLLAALEAEVGEGEIVSARYEAREEDGLLTVTLQAECVEEIGRFVPDQDTDKITEENEADP